MNGDGQTRTANDRAMMTLIATGHAMIVRPA